jgi:hypothetical protein
MATKTKPKTTTKAKPKKYSLKMTFNGEEFNTKTNDLDDAILSLKPELLHTEVYVTATKGKEESERRLSLTQAKRVFRDDLVRQVFIHNLLLN